MAQSPFPLLHQLAMLFVQSVLGAKRAHLVRAKDRDTTSSSMLHSPHRIFRLFPPPSYVRFQLANVHFLHVRDEVLVSFSLCLQTRVRGAVPDSGR